MLPDGHLYAVHGKFPLLHVSPTSLSFATAATAAAVDLPHWRQVKEAIAACQRPTYFKHRPVITLLQNGREVEITGRVNTARPKTSQATERGWSKWHTGLEEAIKLSKEQQDAVNAALKVFFDQRAADKEAAFIARCDRAQRAGKPIPKRPEPKTPPAGWHTFIKDPELKQMVDAKISNGRVKQRLERYLHKRGFLAGRQTEGFVEEFDDCSALRTALGIIGLQLFNSALPKFSDIVFGYDKTTVYNASDSCSSPLTVRDMPYLEVDRRRRCLFVVDLDGWWVDVAALRAALRKFLPEHLMPNIISHRGDEERGGLSNPHLLWMLPPGSRVIHVKGKSKVQQFRLHDMLQRAIVSHLIPLGADPDHHNKDKMKNPLSAAWSISCFDEHFATMDEWRQALPTITTNYKEMKRRAKLHKISAGGGDLTLSNAIWHDGIVARRIAIRSAQDRQDPAFLAAIRSHSGFCTWLQAEVTTRLSGMHPDSPSVVAKVVAAQMEFVRDLQLTPSATGSWCERGRDWYRNQREAWCTPSSTAEERKSQEIERKSRAGTLSRKQAMDVNLGLIAEEIDRRLCSGVWPVKADVVKALVAAKTVSRSVAYARFDFVLQTVLQAARYQAQHFSGNNIGSSSLPSDQPAVRVPEVSGFRTSASASSSSVVSAPAVGIPVRMSTNFPLHRGPTVDPEGQHAYLLLERWMDALQKHRDACRPLASDETGTAAMLDSSAWSRRIH